MHEPFVAAPVVEIAGWRSSPRLDRVARLISRVASPPSLAVAATLIVGAALDDRTAWLWAGFYLFLAAMVPFGYVLVLWARGEVSDLDLSRREERAKPYLLTLVAMLIAAFTLVAGNAPRELVTLSVACSLQTALLMAVTLRWKISAHSAAAAALTVIAVAVMGTVASWTAVAVPAVCWSRVRLGRHDVPQTIAGAIVGAVVLTATWLVV